MLGKGLLVFVLLLLPIHALSRQGAFNGALLTVPGASDSRASLGEVDRRHSYPLLHRQLLQDDPESEAIETKPTVSNSSSNGSATSSEEPGSRTSVNIPGTVQLRDSDVNSLTIPSFTPQGTGCSGQLLSGTHAGLNQLELTSTLPGNSFGVVGAGQPDQDDCDETVDESDVTDG